MSRKLAYVLLFVGTPNADQNDTFRASHPLLLVSGRKPFLRLSNVGRIVIAAFSRLDLNKSSGNRESERKPVAKMGERASS